MLFAEDEEILPWPEDIPDFYGESYFEVADGHNGFGVQAWSNVFFFSSKEVKEVDGKTYINVAFRSSILSVPADAAPIMHKQVNEKLYSCGYQTYEIDVKSKMMKAIGLLMQPEKSTMDRGCYGSTPQTVDFHGWTTKLERKPNQCILNPTNTAIITHILSWEDGGITIMFAMHPSPFCPVFAVSKQDLCYEQARRAHSFLCLDGKADYRQFHDPESDVVRTVQVLPTFNSVHQIDTIEESFFCELSYTLRWYISRYDIASYVTTSPLKLAKWKPNWVPPEFTVVNSNSSNGNEIQVLTGPVTIETVGADVFACQTVNIKGSFYELFELENYPFDIQPLNVTMNSSYTQQRIEWVISKEGTKPPLCHPTEWSHFDRKEYDIADITETKSDNSGIQYTFEVRMVAERKYFVYLYRIVVMMFFFVLVTLSGFALDPVDSAGDRLSIAITMLLTATAYSLVVAGQIPTLGYLTLVDKFILLCFAAIVIIIGQFMLMKLSKTSFNENLSILYINLAVLLVGGLAIFSYVRGIVGDRRDFNRKSGTHGAETISGMHLNAN